MDPHDDGRETLLEWTNVRTVRTPQSKCATNLGVIFCIPCTQCNGLQVKPTIQVRSANDVLKGWDSALRRGDVLLFESQRSKRGGNNDLSGRSSDSVSGGLGGSLRGCRGR